MTEHSHKPIMGVPWWLTSPPANVGDVGLTPGGGDLLDEEMATHSSILAWEIPWTEEPGGLQPMGCKRVRHDLATKTTKQQASYVKLILPVI